MKQILKNMNNLKIEKSRHNAEKRIIENSIRKATS